MRIDPKSINTYLAPTAILAAVSVWFFKAYIAGGDLFWHLASGREILSRGSVPTTDSFSYTFNGQEWQNHEWLWDVLFWSGYRLHPDLVAWANIAVLLAIFGLVFLAARSLSDSTFAAGIAVWLAAASSYWFLDIRPHLFTLLFISLVLATYQRRWAPWLWPVLMVLWVNIHAGFVFGLGAIGLLVLATTIESSWRERRLVISRRAWFGLALSLVAWLANPWGWRIVEYPLAYAGTTIYRTLIEWHPPQLGLDPRFYEGRFWWFVALTVAGILAGGERKRPLFALYCVTLAMAITSRRFIPLFLVVGTPFLALAIMWVRDRIVRIGRPLRSPWAGTAICIVTFAIAAVMWSSVKIGPSLLRHWAVSDRFPEAAVRYLNALGPPNRVLNDYGWGGYLMLKAPGSRVFIDGRANTLYDEAIFQDNIRFTAGAPTPESLAHYTADVALLPKEAFASTLLQLDPPWQSLYEDSQAVILAPPGSPLTASDLPSVEDVLRNDIELLIKRARAEEQVGRVASAIDNLEQAITADPLAVRAYVQLAGLHARRGDLERMADAIERGVRENPRQVVRLRWHEVLAYLRAGDKDRAYAIYRATPDAGPFVPRQNWDTFVRRVERSEPSTPSADR